jgi:hypothetical protein
MAAKEFIDGTSVESVLEQVFERRENSRSVRDAIRNELVFSLLNQNTKGS